MWSRVGLVLDLLEHILLGEEASAVHLLLLSGTDAINYIKAWNRSACPAAGYKMNGAGFLTSRIVLKEVKDQANGATTSLFWAVTLDNAENKAFVDAYQKEYNLLPDVFAVQAWTGCSRRPRAAAVSGDTSTRTPSSPRSRT